MTQGTRTTQHQQASCSQHSTRQPRACERLPVITVVGTGGGGKTRLATAVAHDHVVAFGDQVFFVALAGVTDAPGVAAAVAGVLEVRASADRPVEEAVCDALRPRSSLLVLDNFEQVMTAAEFVSFLTEQCPLLTVLVTSRAPLHIRGERVYELERLSVGSVEAPAVLLFCERARSAQPTFVLSGDNTASVLEVCDRLEGPPQFPSGLSSRYSGTCAPPQDGPPSAWRWRRQPRSGGASGSA